MMYFPTPRSRSLRASTQMQSSRHRKQTGFLDLPPELRLQIYYYLLPSRQEIEFSRPKLYNCTANPQKPFQPWHHNDYHFNICLTNRLIAQETCAIVYSENVFRFEAERWVRPRMSCTAPPEHDPFGFKKRIRVYRKIRNMVLTIDFTSSIKEGQHTVRMRNSLQKFVNHLLNDNNGGNETPGLRSLSVRYCVDLAEQHIRGSYSRPRYASGIDKKHMFSIEPLAQLSGVPEVTCIGLAPWMATCLEMCIKGEGGGIREMKWSSKLVRKRKRKDAFEGGGRKYTFDMTLKRWNQPTLDWREFAIRNGVEYDGGLYDHFFTTIE